MAPDRATVDGLQAIAAALRDVAAAIRATIPPAPEPMPAPAVETMPDALRDACVRYAYGDRRELDANFALARRLLREGTDPATVARAIRAGGKPVAVAVSA